MIWAAESTYNVLSAVGKFLTINNDMDAAGFYVGRNSGGAGEYITLCYNGYGGQVLLSHNEHVMKYRIYYNYTWESWRTVSAT